MTGNATPTRPARPLWGVRRRPGRLALCMMRLPLNAYRRDAGQVFGRTFVAFTHLGRRTGRPHQAVAMVLSYDPVVRECVICAAWGPATDWYRNLQAAPATTVSLGRDSFPPEQRFLDPTEALDVAAAFRRAHPRRLRLIARILGWGDLTDDARLAAFVHDHPFVAFRPRPTVDTSRAPSSGGHASGRDQNGAASSELTVPAAGSARPTR